MNAVLELIAAHRTVREFAPDPLDDELVRSIVGAARQASTSSNIQGYSLLRIRDPRTRERLVELTGGQPQVAQAGGFFVVSADQRRHRLMAGLFDRSYEPNLETWILTLVDASLFAQNLALGFESHGLGVCFIGGLRNRLPEVDELLELPDDVLPLFGMCVGVPAADPGVRPRLPLEAVLLEERYPGDEEMLREIARYDEVMASYYAERGKPGWNWSDGTSRKFATPRRAHLSAYYAKKGARFS